MNRVILLRGISGTGKSTYQKREFPDAIVCSADHFFLKKDGSYVFAKERLGLAHKVCFDKFSTAVEEQKPLIVVDNTNLSTSEIKKYVETAQKAGYDVEILTINCNPDIAAARNAHQVPKDTVIKMSEKLGRVQLPADWKHYQVDSSSVPYSERKLVS